MRLPNTELTKGRYRARLADGNADILAAQRLRSQVFQNRSDQAAIDQDKFDNEADHVLVELCDTGQIVCCFRVTNFPDPVFIENSYSAQFYDLGRLQKFTDPMIEIGRFTVNSTYVDADILRLAWGFLAQIVDHTGSRMLFGCTSFQGLSPEIYADAFGFLRNQYLAPKQWRPGLASFESFSFSEITQPVALDFRNAMRQIPPLLRTYLAMGGWVSDHAVIDRNLSTMHVFTGLEVANIPRQRVKSLRKIYQ